MSAEVYPCRAGPPDPGSAIADEPEAPRGAGPNPNPRPGMTEKSFRRGLYAGLGLAIRLTGRSEDLEGAVLLLVKALNEADGFRSSDEYIRNLGNEIERRVLGPGR